MFGIFLLVVAVIVSLVIVFLNAQPIAGELENFKEVQVLAGAFVALIAAIIAFAGNLAQVMQKQLQWKGERKAREAAEANLKLQEVVRTCTIIAAEFARTKNAFIPGNGPNPEAMKFRFLRDNAPKVADLGYYPAELAFVVADNLEFTMDQWVAAPFDETLFLAFKGKELNAGEDYFRFRLLDQAAARCILISSYFAQLASRIGSKNYLDNISIVQNMDPTPFITHATAMKLRFNLDELSAATERFDWPKNLEIGNEDPVMTPNLGDD